MSRPLGAVFVRWGTPRDPHPPALTLTTLVRRREKRIGLTSNYLDVTHTHPHNFVTHNSFTQTMSRTHSSFTHTHTTLSHTHTSLSRTTLSQRTLSQTPLSHTHTPSTHLIGKKWHEELSGLLFVYFFLQRITKYPSPHFQERVLYRLLSGWHASTSISIAKNFYAPGHWSYNVRPPSYKLVYKPQ